MNTFLFMSYKIKLSSKLLNKKQAIKNQKYFSKKLTKIITIKFIIGLKHLAWNPFPLLLKNCEDLNKTFRKLNSLNLRA